jgi:hypothetical protein
MICAPPEIHTQSAGPHDSVRAGGTPFSFLRDSESKLDWRDNALN